MDAFELQRLRRQSFIRQTTAEDIPRVIQRMVLRAEQTPAAARLPQPAHIPARGASGDAPPGRWDPNGRSGLVALPTGGRITSVDRASQNFTDARLVADLERCCQELGLSLVITDALREGNARYGAKSSRHKQGKALDIGQVSGRRCTLQNPDALRMAHWFIEHGYRTGTDYASSGGLIFGPCGSAWNRTQFDHSTHIHLSVP